MTKRWTKHAWLIGSALSWPLLAGAVHAQILPTGGSTQAGAVSIGAPTAAHTITVTQLTARGVVDWTSFSIGSGGFIQFNNGSGATLNRVTGPTASQIDGKLGATGSVYLLNPNGVVVGTTGVVSTGGSFVASTLATSNAAFMAGGDQTLEGSSTASVINLGKISSLGGNVVLAARTVENKGQLVGPGSTGLLAGSKVLLSDTDGPDGRFQVLVGSASDSATNKGGFIYGSIAELKANGGNIYALAGDTSGTINAIGVSSSGGRVYLTPGAGGAVQVDATPITARVQGGVGGHVVIGSNDAASTVIGSYSPIDASASNGAGGLIEISGQSVGFNFTSTPNMKGVGGADGELRVTANSLSLNYLLLDNALKTGDVVATALTGDVSIAGLFTFSGEHRLTVNAAANFRPSYIVGVTGAKSELVLNVGGDYYAGYTISFYKPETQGLVINGDRYTLISTAAQLQAISGGGYYALANSIDLSSIANFDPRSLPSGVFAGLGNRISNLQSSGSVGNAAGLFQAVGDGATIRDLGLDGGLVTYEFNGYAGFSIGALANSNSGRISNVWSTVKVELAGGVNAAGGGLVGSNYGVIRNAVANGGVKVTGGLAAGGGLVGSNRGDIYDSHASGLVESAGGSASLGGLVGANFGSDPAGASGTITNSYATGAVVGVDSAALGGLVGKNIRGVINGSYATGKVLGNIRPPSAFDTMLAGAGGLVGYSSGGMISDSHATGEVNVVSYSPVGGLVGQYDALAGAAIITRSYAIGAVAAAGPDYVVGGLVGLNDGGAITDAYATGSVTGYNGSGWVGGLLGRNSGSVTNAYATGHLSSTGVAGSAGGIVGENDGTITQVYWDWNTTGLLFPAGTNTGTLNNVQAVGDAPASSPYLATSYAGFDFVSVWTPPSAGVRPKLR